MGRLHYFTLLVLIILLAIASGGLFRSFERKPIIPTEAPRHVPDYFLKNFTATTMDPRGRTKYVVKAEHLDHFADDDSMDMQQPWFEFFEARGDTWTAVAQQGQILEKGKKIMLSGKVVLQQPQLSGREAVVVNADQLTILPDKHVVETSQRVEVLQGKHRITADGMKADMQSGRLEFLANTRSYYVIPEK